MCQKAKLYQNAPINKDMKVLFVWSKKGAILVNWITKLETEFAERKKKINNLENNCSKM